MATLKVMTFNVRVACDEGPRSWDARSGLNVRVIRRISPDVIGFQELMEVHWRTYRAGLADYDGELGPRYNNSEPHAFSAVLWRRSRLEAAGRGGFWLSETPEVFSGSWETACIRSCGWVRLRDLRTGGTLLFADTHLDHRSEQARLEGARLVAGRLGGLRREGEAVILAGDFNCRPGSPAHGELTRAGFVDLWSAAGLAEGPESATFHAFEGVPSARHGRIDWIMALPGGGGPGVRVERAGIVRDAEPPVYPSDHWPLAVDVAI